MTDNFREVIAIPSAPGESIGVSNGQGYEQKFKFIPGRSVTKRLCRNAETDVVELNLQRLVDNPKYVEGSKEPKQITEQVYLERALHLAPDTLEVTNTDFWGNHDYAKVKLYSEGNTFNMSLPEHILKVRILEATGEVLPTLSEPRAGRYQDADFYFSDEQVEAELKESKQNEKIRAYTEFNALTPIEKMRVSRVLDIIKGNDISGSVVSTNLFSFIDDDAKPNQKKAFLRVVDEYKANKELFNVRDEILYAIELGIIRKSGGRYNKITESNQIGTELGVSVEQIVEFYTSPKNDDLRDQLKKDIKIRTKK